MKSVASAIVLMGIYGGLPHSVWADDVQSDSGEAKKAEKIEVTGSNIKRVSKETASPLQVISRQEIQDSGATTVAEILLKATSVTSGLSDMTPTNSFAEGGSNVSLRNLGSEATLVLLNGRRMAPFGLTDGQAAFTNIDSLPAAIVDRIEILKDGASSIYGSDAMAGVINIITRKNYHGAQVDVSSQLSQRIHKAGETDGDVTFGVGDLDTDGYNLVGMVEAYHRNAVPETSILNQLDAQFYKHAPNTGVWSTFSNPGNFALVNQNTGAFTGVLQPVSSCPAGQIQLGTCRFDQWAYADVTTESDRYHGFLSAHYNFNDGLQGYSELLVSHIKFWSPSPVPYIQSGGTPWTYPLGGMAGSPSGSFSVPYLSPTNPFNTTGQVVGLRYRFNDDTSGVGNGAMDNEYRFVTGLKGSASAWDWEAGMTVSGSNVTQTNSGYPISIAGFNALFGPFTTYTFPNGNTVPLMSDHPGYNLGGQNSQAVYNELFPTLHNVGESREITLDATASRSLATLSGGDLSMAVGMQLRRDTMTVNFDPLAKNGGVYNDSVAVDVTGHQNIASVYTEFLAPFTKKLEADFAIRVDKYPNFGASITPKLGAKYQASDDVLLRGTYSTGFRAPNIPESGNSFIAGYNTVQDPLRCATAAAMQAILYQSTNPTDAVYANDLNDCSVGVPGGSSSNGHLKPEKSQGINLGVVWSPSKSYDISLDYYLLARRNEIGFENSQLVANVPAQYPGQLARGPITSNDLAIQNEVAALCANAPGNGITGCPATPLKWTAGSINYLVTRFQNYGRTLTDGVDIDGHARADLGAFGKLVFGLEGTWTSRYLSFQQGIGPNGSDAWGVNLRGHYGVPAFRSVFSTAWDRGPYHSAVRVNYTSGQSLWNDVTDTTWNMAGCTGQNFPTNVCHDGVGSWTTADLDLGYSGIKHLTLNLNVLNLFNRRPWYDPEGTFAVNQFESLDGRIYKLGASYSF